MEIIRDLEPTPRGEYCGAVGVIAPATYVRARFNVTIRTLVVDTDRGSAIYGTGGGITWDSQPAAEYAELRAKTAVLTAHPTPMGGRMRDRVGQLSLKSVLIPD
ncbi:chorismate-binding protein [Rhodococcus opacus]|uniref:chorismate-binding protein n=1 Tax=Rhodococcus opacus TaxID=37919 RepID=UPI001C20C218